MTLKQLEYLVKIMECGSITQAAAQLSVTQPNLTKAVSSLEEEYGFQMLIRKPRGVEFTQQGRDFLLFAKSVLAAAGSYPKSGAAPAARSRLFIACQQLDFTHPLLSGLCREYRNRNIFFDLQETDRDSVAKHVLQGIADIGFAVRSSADARDLLWNRESCRLDIRTVDKAPTYVAVGPLSPLWGRSSVRASELTGHLHVALDLENQAKHSFWFSSGQYTGYNQSQIVFVNTINACQSILLHTDAVSYCSAWTRGCFHDPQIHTLPVEDAGSTQELIFIRRREEAMTPAEAAFTSAVYRTLGKDVPSWVCAANTGLSEIPGRKEGIPRGQS